MNPYEDNSTATDLGLCVIEAEIERLPANLADYRDRAADIAERLYEMAATSPHKGD